MKWAPRRLVARRPEGTTMTVKDIMKKDVATCVSNDDVATAVKIMHDHKCGFVPVVDSHGLVAGVVTDRDLSIAAAASKHRTAEHIGVTDAMSHPVFSCFPDENLKVVLATMAKHHVRRLPVLDKHGHLQGVLSIDDIVQLPRRRGTPTAEEIVDAFKGICAPRPVEVIAT
jgi:CBS domain-containing protein